MNIKTPGFVVLSVIMVGLQAQAERPRINLNNETGGGIEVSDDGGFFDHNDGFITYEGLCCHGGLRVRDPLTVEGPLTVKSGRLPDGTPLTGNLLVEGQIGANQFNLGSGAGLFYEQGGSLELGHMVHNNSYPFIDFHYGIGALQDYNVRLINNGDGYLSLQSAAPSVSLMLQAGGYIRGAGRLHIQTHAGEDLHLQPHAGAGNVMIGADDGPGTLWVKTKIVTGTLELLSDRNAKADLHPVDAREALEKVADLSIHTWSYTNAPGIRHLGPMAQDFHAAFGLGEDNKHISVVDGLGIALAAIQGLKQEVTDRDSELKALRDELAALRREVVAVRAATSDGTPGLGQWGDLREDNFTAGSNADERDLRATQ